MESLLDNPIWETLSSYHQHNNEGDDRLKYFYPSISPFVAMADWDSADRDYLEEQLPAERNFFYIIKKKIELPGSCKKYSQFHFTRWFAGIIIHLQLLA